MSDTPQLALPEKEKWNSKLGVVLAVAGSAVGLGNFLRFPGQAVNNGGGAFMIPYIISFLILGIPIAWCEWTMGRLGGRYGQNSAPGIMYALYRKTPAKFAGAMTLLIPVVIYMYYVVLEAWCLDYCIEFARGGFSELFARATADVADHAAEVSAIVSATGNHFQTQCGLTGHGSLFESGRMVWLVLFCFLVNFFIIYQGVTRGIEVFCKWAMPALIICATVILIRVLTLPGISTGLGFMWNPKWDRLADPQVWLAAAGQIFFSLSVGFGLILCYSSYLRSNDDVVLTSLSASSTNEFCEVVLGGMIVVPTAFLFLGSDAATSGTFGLGFITVPAIMHFMPGGSFFGALWFGLLFLAAVTSSLSMLQPAIAFLEDGFGMRRRASVAILGVITLIGASFTMYFSKNALVLDHTDFWCNLMMILAATFQVLIFGWIIGAERGVREMNRGADLHVPRGVAFLIRYVTPTFLIVILVAWSYNNLPGYLDQMNPSMQGELAARGAYADAIKDHFAADNLDADTMTSRIIELLGSDEQPVVVGALVGWLGEYSETAEEARSDAAHDANIARTVLIGILVFFVFLVVLSDIACRNRIGRTIRAAEGTL
ncbi:MAG: sodium-dependent transporter [Planctomycetes bacterium]|nr:sodium-dependent transporter [Planctomycetota bacterium]